MRRGEITSVPHMGLVVTETAGVHRRRQSALSSAPKARNMIARGKRRAPRGASPMENQNGPSSSERAELPAMIFRTFSAFFNLILRAFGAARTKFTWGKAMSGRNFTSAALTIVLVLLVCPVLIAQKKKSPPAATPPAPASTTPTGELIGKRITFTDGATLDVDDTWKQGDTIWYRLHGTSQSLNRPVRTIENRYKEAPPSNKATTKTVAAKPAPVVTTWIYLVDGARLRVDEVR